MNHEKYLRIPYKDQGIDESGVDCYGLVRLVVRDELHTYLPETPPPATTWRRYCKIIKPPPKDILPFDIVMFSEILPELTNHIGIMVTPHDVLHAGKSFGGVVCQPLAKYKIFMIGVGRIT